MKIDSNSADRVRQDTIELVAAPRHHYDNHHHHHLEPTGVTSSSISAFAHPAAAAPARFGAYFDPEEQGPRFPPRSHQYLEVDFSGSTTKRKCSAGAGVLMKRRSIFRRKRDRGNGRAKVGP